MAVEQSKNRKSVDRVPKNARFQISISPPNGADFPQIKKKHFSEGRQGYKMLGSGGAKATLPGSGDRMGAYMAARNPTSGLTGPLVVFHELAWPNEPIDEASQTMLWSCQCRPKYAKKTTFKPPYLRQMGVDSEPRKPEV